jgi:hypothetical protein
MVYLSFHQNEPYSHLILVTFAPHLRSQDYSRVVSGAAVSFAQFSPARWNNLISKQCAAPREIAPASDKPRPRPAFSVDFDYYRVVCQRMAAPPLRVKEEWS